MRSLGEISERARTGLQDRDSAVRFHALRPNVERKRFAESCSRSNKPRRPGSPRHPSDRWIAVSEIPEGNRESVGLRSIELKIPRRRVRRADTVRKYREVMERRDTSNTGDTAHPADLRSATSPAANLDPAASPGRGNKFLKFRPKAPFDRSMVIFQLVATRRSDRANREYADDSCTRFGRHIPLFD